MLRFSTIIIIVFCSVEYIIQFLNSCLALLSVFDINSSHISLLIKVVAIAILTDIVSDNLKDSGDVALSNTVILLSKFLILYMTIPIFNGIIIFCLKFVDL